MLSYFLMLCVAVGSTGFVAVTDEEKADKKDESRKFEVRVEKVVKTEKSDQDKEGRTKVSGQVVIMGPDGKVAEYSLDEKLPESVRVLIHRGDEGEHADEERNVFVFGDDAEQVQERLMIGVHCDAADEVLRAHLKLDEAGLVVLEVIDDSPAMEAGVEKNDVLFSANGATLAGVETLVDVVQESDGKQIEFGVIRAGDRMEIQVTPRRMKMDQHFIIDHLEDVDIELDGADGSLKWVENMEELELPEEALKALKAGRTGVRLRRLQPGIVIDRNVHGKELDKLIESVREKALAESHRAEEARKSAAEAHQHLEELHQHARETHAKAAELAASEMRNRGRRQQSVEAVQAQMKELQAQMKALQQTLKELSAKADRNRNDNDNDNDNQ